MPRRHKPIKHTPYRPPAGETSKKRYPTRQAAEKAAGQVMLLNPSVELRVYRGLDGGWYLTRSQGDSKN